MKLPDTVGLGFKTSHFDEICEGRHPVRWFEVHPENYMGAGGPPHRQLERIRSDYALSMHGVGMSLGSAEGVDTAHLQRLAQLVDRYQPHQVSEHIAWSHANARFHNDLLPIPYHAESLACICANIDRVQSTLGRPILVENPSSYLWFRSSEMSEPEFITEVQKRTGCGLLLDVNNVYVSAHNNGLNAIEYINSFPLLSVGEIHLAGHSCEWVDDHCLLIDDHGSPVTEEVWQLFQYTLGRLPESVPVLIEWDTDVPAFSEMLAEASRARSLITTPQIGALAASA